MPLRVIYTDNITSQLGCIASDNFIYENKTQSVAIKLDEFNVFLFCSKVWADNIKQLYASSRLFPNYT